MSKKTIILICSVFAIILALFVNGIWLNNNDDRGTFGDMFGAANALFSGLAFGGIIYTILLQRDDLKDAKEEFRIQQFDTNLYNLINSHLKLIEQLSYKGDDGVVVSGKNVFKTIYESKKQKNNTMILFHEQDDLDHYFRNIYRILKIISRVKFERTEEKLGTIKYHYSNILRSLLSTYELKCILFWCIQDGNIKNIEGKDNGLITYVNDYSLLKNISKDLKDTSLHPALKSSAFEPVKPSK